MEAGPNEQIHFAFRAICQNTCFLCHTQRKKKELDKGPNGCLLPFPNSVLTRPFQTSKTPSPILRKKGESKTIQTLKSNEHNKHTWDMGEGRKIKSVDEILQQHLLLHSAHQNDNIILIEICSALALLDFVDVLTNLRLEKNIHTCQEKKNSNREE